MKILSIKLIDVKKGNSKNFTQGSWIHPTLAIQLAQWISPAFAIQVSMWVQEIAITGKVNLKTQKTNEQLLLLQKQLVEERKEKEDIKKKHKNLLLKRHCHQFKKGPIFYIISDGSQEKKFKVGIDDKDINRRLSEHRTMCPEIKVEFLMYCAHPQNIESCILERYINKRKPYLNHEWIFGVDVEDIKKSVITLIEFIGKEYTLEGELEKYNSQV